MAKRKKRTWVWTAPYYERFDANKVGRELTRIKKEYGGVTPAKVVEIARDRSSPLHNLFEWDDTEAARKYRERQASNIIRNVKLVEVGPKGPRVLTGYVLVPGERKIGYVTADSITEQERIDKLIESAMAGLRSWCDRYEFLADQLPGVFPTIKDVLKDYYNR